MEATDLANAIQEAISLGDVEPLGAEVSPGYEEANFFVDVGGERFLVAVMKVSE